jgi:hypothetical protein
MGNKDFSCELKICFEFSFWSVKSRVLAYTKPFTLLKKRQGYEKYKYQTLKDKKSLC